MAARGLNAILPAPVGGGEQADTGDAAQAPTPAKKAIPPYGQRKGWVPRSQADFAGGGAFPEVHVAQYPLDMGKKGKQATQLVSVTTDGNGSVKYDGIARVGHREGQKVYTSLSDATEKRPGDSELERPDEAAIAATTQETKEALEKLVEGKISAAHNPRGLPTSGKAADRAAPTFIRYTPSAGGAGAGSAGGQRVIRMVEAPKDPMEPPKFKHKRVPGGPPSPPVPVLHSPPRKVTVKDKQDWKIPPVVSSWKNAKGYTVPLDKRLAADGRGLQEVQISDNFAKLSESLYVAERTAREEVEKRNALQKKLLMKEKAAKEEELRALAQKARTERAAVVGAGLGADGGSALGAGAGLAAVFGAPPPPPPGGPPLRAGSPGVDGPGREGEDEEARALEAEREEIRRERKRERERERRLEASGDGKRGKLTRERERDVSEKVALGQAAPTTADTLYDQRLFNQSQGLASGLGGDDDGYNIYDKALFAGGSGANAIYRHKKADDGGWGADEDGVAAEVAKQARFRPDKGFAGAEGGGGGGAAGGGPVQFEADNDPFGLNQFLTEASSKAAAGDDARRGGGALAAGGGGSTGLAAEGGSGRTSIGFQREGSGR